MGAIFAYSITSSILLTAMYLIYKSMLAGENQHAYNRAILWCIYLSALVVPFIIPSISEWANNTTQINIDNTNVEIATPIINLAENNESLSLSSFMLVVYCSGIIIALFRTIATFVKLSKIIHSGERIYTDKFTIIITSDLHIAPFSWMKHIVMSRNDYESSSDVIIAHESRHLKLNHWIDLLAAQLIAILQWFNPTAWLMREELKTVHEYQADEAVIESGANIKEYQMLLIKKAVGARFPSLANSLNHSKLKKRVTMMYKSKSTIGRRLRAVAIIPAGILAIMAINLPVVASAIDNVSAAAITLPSDDKGTKNEQNAQKLQLSGKVINISSKADTTRTTSTSSKLPIYINGKKQDSSFDINSISTNDIEAISIVKSGDNPGTYITLKSGTTAQKQEKMAEFPGGESELLKWIGQNIKYPENVLKENISGNTVIMFQINENGAIGETKIMQSVHPDIDKEVTRVIKSMPKWTPASIDGNPVAIWYTLPIAFNAYNGK